MNREEVVVYFMAAALQGLLVNEKYTIGMDQERKEKQIAEKAARYAYAMREELERAYPDGFRS